MDQEEQIQMYARRIQLYRILMKSSDVSGSEKLQLFARYVLSKAALQKIRDRIMLQKMYE